MSVKSFRDDMGGVKIANSDTIERALRKLSGEKLNSLFNVLYYSRLCEINSSQVENARSAVHLAERQEELGQMGHADVVQMLSFLLDYNHVIGADIYGECPRSIRGLLDDDLRKDDVIACFPDMFNRDSEGV